MVTPQYRDWVQELKVLDLVDCIKVDRVVGKCCWSRAKIVGKSLNDFSIRFLNEDSNDRVVGWDSAEIMPYQSRTPDYDTLLELKYTNPNI